MDNNKKQAFTFVDLFAGCGGLSLGLEQAGFKPVFVNEINDDALATYQTNRADEFPYLLYPEFFTKDVKELVLYPTRLNALKQSLYRVHGIDINNKSEGLDLLVGGPPCQGYSGIGYRRSYSVDKKQLPSNHLYEDMAYLISQLKPKLFLFENVKGLLNSKWTKGGSKGEIWEDVQRTFQALDAYSIRSQLVLSKDYSVPQNRPRILLVGIRKDINFKIDDISEEKIAGGLLPHPDTYSVKPPNLNELLGDLIDPDYQNGGSTNVYPFDPMNEIQSALRMTRDGQVASEGQPVTEHDYSKHSPHVVRKFQHMIEHDGEIPEQYKTKKFSQKVLKSKWNTGGPNITVTSLADDYVHWAQPRSLTVRECARIQTFPDWYQFMGKRTTGGMRRAGNPREDNHEREVPKYTQIGNAVPVRLAKILGLHFSDILGAYKKRKANVNSK